MTQEELKEFIKNNLRVEVKCNKRCVEVKLHLVDDNGNIDTHRGTTCFSEAYDYVEEDRDDW